MQWSPWDFWSKVPLANRLVGLGSGSAGTIKSIQRGTCSLTSTELTNDATLSPAVVVANTDLGWLGTTCSTVDAGWGTKYNCRLTLESTTVVRQTRGLASNLGTEVVIIGWQVKEEY